MKSDVAIIGAGVIGCSIAYYLAKANVSVCLIEKAERVGAEASWAGAGILASHASTQEPYAALCRASLELYPELAESLRLETQIDVEFIRCGSIAVAFTEDEKRAMNGLAERRQDRGFSAEMLSGDEVRTLEPALSQSVIGGVLFPHDAQVRNPKLVKALAKSAAQVGAQFLLGNPVTAFVSEGGRISGVVVNGSAHHADTYVIACGCWSGQIASLLGYSLPVGPANGQMVLAEAMPLCSGTLSTG